MLGLLMGGLWLWVLHGWLRAQTLLSSDSLFMAEFWAALRSGGRLGDWSMALHAYVFPDLGFYQVAAWWTEGVVERQVAYGLLQGFLFWWFGSRLVARLFDLEASQGRVYAAAGLLLLLPLLGDASGLGQWLFPAHHGGALIAGVWLLDWALGQEEAPGRWKNIFVLAALASLAQASDGLFGAWALAPILLLSLGLGHRARVRIWVLALLSWAGHFLWLVYWKAEGMRILKFKWAVAWEHRGDILTRGLEAGRGFVGDHLSALSLVVVTAALLLSRRERRPLNLLGAAILALVVGGGLLSLLQGQFAGRYFAWSLWMAALVTPALLSRRWPKLDPLTALAPCAIALLWLLLSPPPHLSNPLLRQSAWLSAQLAPRGLSAGWADYGHARPLRLLSEAPLRLTPMNTDTGEPRRFEWLSQKSDFAGDPDRRRPDFVVVNGLDAQRLDATLKGAPLRLTGEGLELWIYKGSK